MHISVHDVEPLDSSTTELALISVEYIFGGLDFEVIPRVEVFFKH